MQQQNNNLAPVKKKNRGRYSLPKDKTQRRTGKDETYAYVVKDKCFGEFKVLNSMNAWWLDSVKISQLIDAFKIDANDDEACFYAGVTIEQLKYFTTLHPEFYTIKHMCRQNLGLIAKKNFALGVEKDKAMSLEYLKMKRKDEGYTNRSEQTGANGRDLYDAMTQELKKLGEDLRASKYEPSNNKNKEYPDQPGAIDINAGQAGNTDEAGASGDATGRQDVPAKDGELVQS
jgi:hypothetical protein